MADLDRHRGGDRLLARAEAEEREARHRGGHAGQHPAVGGRGRGLGHEAALEERVAPLVAILRGARRVGDAGEADGVWVEALALDRDQDQIEDALGVQLDGGDQLARAPVRVNNIGGEEDGKRARIRDGVARNTLG